MSTDVPGLPGRRRDVVGWPLIQQWRGTSGSSQCGAVVLGVVLGAGVLGAVVLWCGRVPRRVVVLRCEGVLRARVRGNVAVLGGPAVVLRCAVVPHTVTHWRTVLRPAVPLCAAVPLRAAVPRSGSAGGLPSLAAVA